MSQIRLLKKIICIDTGLLLIQFTPVASRISESWQIEKNAIQGDFTIYDLITQVLKCHMESHSVTCHPTEVRIPPLPPAEAGTRFNDPGGMQG